MVNDNSVDPQHPKITKAEFDAARDQGNALRRAGPLASAVRYRAGFVRVTLNNGCAFEFPVSHAQGLSGAPAAKLSKVEVTAGGLGLYWPELDADLYVPTLLGGVLGTSKWMAALGSVGGKSTSAAKRLAAAANGKRGGRPRRVSI